MSRKLNIGQAAAVSGVSAKMIRHYESIGLIANPPRTEAGYRLYGDKEVHVLRFIRHARNLGFSVKQLAELLGLWMDEQRPSSKVKALAERHIDELQQKIQELQLMKSELERLVHCCHGDHRPDCPILEQLAQ
jgi:MerR family copper efflux transcriptional regulator